MPNRDWGSDTAARFRYQAEVTLPYCVSALLSENEIRAVIPEHLEDIAIETATGLRFIQVKSRNPERGLWNASDLFAKKGGALRSLYRTYLLTRGEDHSLELALEGAIQTKNVIHKLRPDQDRSELVPLVVEKFGTSRESAEDFLQRVILNESVPPRAVISATNMRLLHECAPQLTQPALQALHRALLEAIENAMRSERMGVLWPRSIAHPMRRSTRMEERLRVKTINAQRLPQIAELLHGAGRPLLKRLVEKGSGPLTPLTQKLVVGGAPREIIDEARNLKANAEYQRFLRATQNLAIDEALTTDLHERIRIHAQTAAAMHQSSPQPAIEMWAYLLQTFGTQATTIDPNNVVGADFMLLMGEGCILSDQCDFNWGETTDVAE